MDINVDLLQQFKNVLIKKLLVAISKMKIFLKKNQQKNYTRQLLENLMKEKYTHLLLTIFGGADLPEMQLISKFNKGFRILLYVIDVQSKYALAIPLRDKKGITITNDFQKILNESNRKPNKIWVDKGSAFYNRSMKS